MPYIPKKLFDELQRAGAMCSNVCYNIAQQRQVQETWPVRESFEAWDKAKENIHKHWARKRGCAPLAEG